MDWNRVEGNWKQVKGKVKEKWGKLTDGDLTAINSRRDQLEGKIQDYRLAMDQAPKEIDDWYGSQFLVMEALKLLLEPGLVPGRLFLGSAANRGHR